MRNNSDKKEENNLEFMDVEEDIKSDIEEDISFEDKDMENTSYLLCRLLEDNIFIQYKDLILQILKKRKIKENVRILTKR